MKRKTFQLNTNFHTNFSRAAPLMLAAPKLQDFLVNFSQKASLLKSTWVDFFYLFKIYLAWLVSKCHEGDARLKALSHPHVSQTTHDAWRNELLNTFFTRVNALHFKPLSKSTYMLQFFDTNSRYLKVSTWGTFYWGSCSWAPQAGMLEQGFSI